MEIRDRRKTEWFWCDKSVLKSKIFQSTKLVYFALCCFANEKTQIAYPSKKVIAGIAGVSERTVDYAIADLVKGKLVSKIAQEGRHNIYTLLPVTTATIAQVVLAQLDAENHRNRTHKTTATDRHESASNILNEHTKRTGNLDFEGTRKKFSFLQKKNGNQIRIAA